MYNASTVQPFGVQVNRSQHAISPKVLSFWEFLKCRKNDPTGSVLRGKAKKNAVEVCVSGSMLTTWPLVVSTGTPKIPLLASFEGLKEKHLFSFPVAGHTKK